MSPRRSRLAGLYLLADESALPYADWPQHIPACLDAGVRLVQYRGKQQSRAEQYAHAATLLQWCRQRDIPLLINDDVALCLQLGADGVHLGRDDGQWSRARAQLGADRLLGFSCYNELERAQQAIAADADYVSFGRLFASRTKPEASPARLSLLRQARQRWTTPICGIGGITPDNAQQVKDAGADLLCVAAAVLAADKPSAACRKLATIAG